MDFAFAVNLTALNFSFFVAGAILGAVFAPYVRRKVADAAELVLRYWPVVSKTLRHRD